METAARRPLLIGVDTGGTFTDIYASDGRVLKVPSTPADPSQAILEGVRRLAEGRPAAVAHGTTVATNAVLERKGARTALITTAGFEDVLAIRRQNRPALYDLYARWPDPLVPDSRRYGLNERLDYRGEVLSALDPAEVGRLAAGMAGWAESVAVCLLFSYLQPAHERAVGKVLARVLGESVPVSLSSRIAPRFGEYERTSTTVVNAYVMPMMQRYLAALAEGLAAAGVRDLHVMHSNGGLMTAAAAASIPAGTILSGPAAGVVGARAIAARASEANIITFDMGGTSTDVAVVPGEILERPEGTVAGFPLMVPMLLIETVGAGGGSIARIDAAGGLRAGPESAGAVPGPAAYGLGTEPTVTDANLVLGRLSPSGLLGGDMPLDEGRARQVLGDLGARLGLTPEQAAWAVVRLANSNMARAVRTVSLQRGHDPRRFTLFAFGGAGPLHAAELAADLGIRKVLVPPHPGVLAALGLTVPDLVRDYYRAVLLPLDALDHTSSVYEELIGEAQAPAQDETLFGAPNLTRSLDVRFAGQSFDLRVPYVSDPAALRDAFLERYQQRYGYAPAGQEIEIVNVRLRLTRPRVQHPQLMPSWSDHGPARGERLVWFGADVGLGEVSARTASVWWRPALVTGTGILGPAVIEQYDSVTVVPPNWRMTVDERMNLILEHEP